MRNGNLTGPVSCPRENKEEGYFLFFFDNEEMLERRDGRARIVSRLITTTPLELSQDSETEVTQNPTTPSPVSAPPPGPALPMRGTPQITTAAYDDMVDVDMVDVAILQKIERVLELVGQI